MEYEKSDYEHGIEDYICPECHWEIEIKEEDPIVERLHIKTTEKSPQTNY